jgi:hypothetical protein
LPIQIGGGAQPVTSARRPYLSAREYARPTEKLASIREIRGCNQLFANPSAMATALRMAMDLFTDS